MRNCVGRKFFFVFIVLGAFLSITFSPSFSTAEGTEFVSWEQSESHLPYTRALLQGLVTDKYLYAIGGTDPVTSCGTSTVYYAPIESDGDIGEWQLSPNSLLIARHYYSLIYHNNYVYVIGGNACGGPQSEVQYAYLDPESGEIGPWQLTTYLPAGRRRHTSVVYNNRLYVMGGSNYAKNTVYYASFNPDGTVGSWTLDPTPLPAAMYYQSSVLYSGYVFLFGGRDDVPNIFDNVWSAKINEDGSVGPWHENSYSLPTTLYGSRSFIFEDRVFVLGGTTSALQADTQNKIYYAKLNNDGTTGPWKTHYSQLPVPLYLPGVAIGEENVYVVGGIDNVSSRYDTTHYFPVSDLLPAPNFISFTENNQNINIDPDQIITTNPYTIRVKPTDVFGIEKVEFYVDENLICTITDPDSDGYYLCDWDTSKFHSEIKILAYNTEGKVSEPVVISAHVALFELPTELTRVGINIFSSFWHYFISIVLLMFGLTAIIRLVRKITH